MNRKKIISLVTALFLTLAISATGAFAWFFVAKQSNKIDISTAFIAMCIANINGAENKLPGESVLITEAGGVLNNTSSRDIIVEVVLDENIKAALKSGSVPTSNLMSDYTLENGKYVYSPARAKKVVKGRIDVSNRPEFVEHNGKVYAVIEQDTDIKVPNMYVDLLPELGGHSLDKVTNTMTPERIFEQATSFEVTYSVKAVQRTKEACIDLFGQDAVNKFPASFFN